MQRGKCVRAVREVAVSSMGVLHLSRRVEMRAE